ncbi:hypothetical protein N482_09050 [Pseudoalteromonas luteoviolacea NCIMB 1942]|uniref:Uncharacterized protein n=1 Tax=Pseudoalteromonas luteoviolacea NCIMB 1942 TaxID=1365253 RepID=A0A167CKA0_9GAMM|nr:hypothetical protein N482_09050 [Pseudoalteromonas luteoviolacea NCIMB 1942]
MQALNANGLSVKAYDDIDYEIDICTHYANEFGYRMLVLQKL